MMYQLHIKAKISLRVLAGSHYTVYYYNVS